MPEDLKPVMPPPSRRQDGSGYGKPAGRHDARLTEVGPGTPCGELMRRYWHPVGRSATTNERPKKVRILGEDLILFRDQSGRPGLLHAPCCHRGTTLFYGKVERDGIRCCYHGWLFDVIGHCLEQPCEPEGGLHRDRVRQPWYPVEERYGLVFAYLGPLDRKPPLPHYDVLEDLGPNEILEVEAKSFYIRGGYTEEEPHAPYSWLQNWENVMDPYHVLILHSRFTGPQFRREFEISPKVEWCFLDHGVAAESLRTLEDGRRFRRLTQVLLPNVRIVPSIELTEGQGREVAWLVPVDDHTHRSFGVARVGKDEEPLYERRSRLATHEGKIWAEMTEDEHQRLPDDYEAQLGQGSISSHSDEHLVTSDRGIVMLRRLLLRQIAAVEEGKDPLGADALAPAHRISVKAGNYFQEEPTTESEKPSP
ncbi:MAG: aromatic ring-hydroxylating dioxygenase subunit alpha [Burkholderiaceae bacterium]